MNAKVIIALLAAALLVSCDRDSSDDDNEVDYPVWILVVQVNDNYNQPVETCARVIWEIRGTGESHTTHCDLENQGVDGVVIWASISEPLTIDYYADCDGYYPSAMMSTYFDPELAYVRPGAPGEEVIERVTVQLTAE